jgi:hypothetical protein
LIFFTILIAGSAACGSEASAPEPTKPASQEGQTATRVTGPTPSATQTALEPTTAVEPQGSEDLEDLTAALNAETVDDRPGVLAYLGRPDAFNISIVSVEGVRVRMESWHYYQYGTRVDFADGEAVWTVEIEPLPEGTIFAAWYDPLAFDVGMTGSEAAQVATAASPAGVEPQAIDLSEGGAELQGGTAMVGDQILIGLSEDEVVYVETVALVPDGGGQ